LGLIVWRPTPKLLRSACARSARTLPACELIVLAEDAIEARLAREVLAAISEHQHDRLRAAVPAFRRARDGEDLRALSVAELVSEA
jgi:hypothetical protein